ncbi:SAM-dependent methyltransferase [Paraburkholderia flava]|uniref:SAM-dependent methyltransferase n=1 Tax=Paraburkholderia flava TaxID=2547393 RepID=UPI00105B91A3|nr:cyclopropane-fatty-acyl-phospholipid synthase family protein [Paraburkholderia flava]
MTFLRTFFPASDTPAAGRLFLATLGRMRHGRLLVTLPDGTQRTFGDPHSPDGAHLLLHDWRACAAILRAGDIGFADAYRAHWLDTPDAVALVRLALANESALPRTVTGSLAARAWYGLRHWLRANTRNGSRRNIHAHYDIGNAFYALWLDPTFTYSSALFEDDLARTLEAAQHAKYQRIVDVLLLRPGMRVLEIGCGWGGFALHAARLGIHVHGVTLSREQLELGRARIAAAGLERYANLELTDYRDLDGQYDAIVSIEMFEAVGERYWPMFFSKVKQCLAPRASALVQSITIDDARFAAYRSSSDFIRETIFPGGMLPSVERFIRAARRGGLRAHESLSFGNDYAYTLRHWRTAFEAQLEAVCAQGFDEIFIRTWRLYLAYCEAGFLEKRTGVTHFLITQGD